MTMRVTWVGHVDRDSRKREINIDLIYAVRARIEWPLYQFEYLG